MARDIGRHNSLDVNTDLRRIPKSGGLVKILVEEICSARRGHWPLVAICIVGDIPQ